MEHRASIARSYLEQMLLDETAKPKALPLTLLEDITGGFSDDQQIGSGGFAVVYKGILGDRAVAVKRLSNVFMDETEFHREVECLMQVKHKNIVRFFGYCADRQGSMEKYNGKFVMADVHQRLLCFEYIPKGSLDKYIIDTCLEWGTCYTIIKGICEGLQYLHENNIIHLDLKPANILLDDNMTPKITDFGVSRCFDENQSRHITKNILGTMGYLAPELCDGGGGVISRSADLYSLGLIIMEILTGQKGHKSIKAVLESWSDRLERSQRDTQRKQIRVCYKIALECREFNPKKRPTSARAIVDRLHVSTTLQQIQARKQQTIDIKSEGNMGVAQRSMAMDPSSLYGQGIMQQKPGLGGAGLNQGVSGLPLKGWPLTGIDQLRPNLGAQMQKPFLSTQSQFQLMSPQQQQQLLAQAQVQGLSNSAHYGDMDPRRFTTLTRAGMNGKDGQPGGTDGCISSPMQSSSPKIRPDQEYLMKMQQTSSQQPQEQLQQQQHQQQNQQQQQQQQQNQQQQMQQNNRKRKQTTSSGPAASKGFTFSEVNCWRISNSKVYCCNFSYDGKILAASAGHEKKAVLWNMDTFQTHYLPEEHTGLITDVRFRPISTQMATSSFDRTIKLWNAADPGYSQHTFNGHNGHVTSLDFHPKKTDLLCSCDGNGEIRYWNVTQLTCVRVIKGGTAQVRFQPNTGQFLAAASENVVSIFDVDTHTKKYILQGHNTDVQSVCWDNTGEYLASVSQDLVKVWSISTGECIHEVSSNGNKFHSCVFHPSYTNLLVIGGYQSMELWNMVKNQSMTVQAHEGLIAALAQSPVTGMVASASHDNSVKLWK